MRRLKTNKTTLTTLRSRRTRSRLMAAVLVLAVGLSAGLVQAQGVPANEPKDYRADKTVADYMSGNDKSAAADFDYAANSLRVETWVDKAADDVYRKGEEINIGFQTNEDAYAVVYRIDSEGLVTVLWPRSRFDDGFVFGGHEYQLPVSGHGKLRVSSAAGEGFVEAVVSRYPFDLRALELDFHHEQIAERYNFYVAGDPFLAMNEVNYAVTGLEDSGEYVVTNYTGYYVHQAVDHPRYLCNQCHVDEQVAYDPYHDECTLTIEYDYSWYNGWYDRYGYYPVYGNPVYVYVDPWSWNPWVNYWYRPAYSCAPWYGWGWGWGPSYSWCYSPYYWGDSVYAYNQGNRRYRPLDRNGISGDGNRTTKTREHIRGSEMVRGSTLSDRDRDTMVARTRGDKDRADRSSMVGRSSRSGGADVAYRGAEPKTRTRSSFDQVATRGRSQGGLRIRESGTTGGSVRIRGGNETTRKRHVAAGEGRRANLAPVESQRQDRDSWRGTTRVGGASTGRSSDRSSSGTSVGNSRDSGSSTGSSRATVGTSRSRSQSGSKSVQPRKRSTRVWNSTSGRSGSSQGTSTRSRGGSVGERSRSGSSSRNQGAVNPRQSGSSRKSSGSKSSGSSAGKTSTRKSSSVKKSSGSRGSSATKSSGSTSRSSSGSSGKSSGNSSRSSGGRSGSSRR